MVAYFCHHLSVDYDNLSNQYVDLLVIYVDLSDHCVEDLSGRNYHNQQLIILFFYRVTAPKCYLLIIANNVKTATIKMTVCLNTVWVFFSA